MYKWIIALCFMSLVNISSVVYAAAPPTASTSMSDSHQGKTISGKTLAEEVASSNAAAGKTFLNWNEQRTGVVTLPSGLQYKIVKPGNGAKPGPTDSVTVDYEGQFINGHVFDSSYQRGKPITLPVNAVIPGWQQALQMMKEGAEWLLYIPSKLAYGSRGVPGKICANQTLLFRVHLLSVNKKAR